MNGFNLPLFAGSSEHAEGEQSGHLRGPGPPHSLRSGPQTPLCFHHTWQRATWVLSHSMFISVQNFPKLTETEVIEYRLGDSVTPEQHYSSRFLLNAPCLHPEMSCLMEALQDKRVRLQPECKKRLQDRIDMWSYAAKVRTRKLSTLPADVGSCF